MPAYSMAAAMRRIVGFFRVVAMVTGAVVLAGTLTPAGLWYALWLGGPWPAQSGGTIVVPGADMEDAETMGLGSYRRAYYARSYWRQGGYTGVILLGHGAAPAMRRWLVFEGVPESSIVVDDESGNTMTNAQQLRRLLREWKDRTGKENPDQPLVLLTSDYHCWRARRVFAAAGVDVVVQPVPDAAKRWDNWTARWSVCIDLGIETAKILWYFVNGRL